MLRRDATNRARPMPSRSMLRVSKARMEEDLPAGIAVTNTDRTVDDIGALARKCNDSRQSRRLRAIAHLMRATSAAAWQRSGPGSTGRRSATGQGGTMRRGRTG